MTGLKAGWAAAGLAALALGGCSSLDTRPNVGPCPVVGSLYDASRLVEVGAAERHENVGFTASIEGANGFCRYVGKNPLTMGITVDFAFGKGPAAQGDTRSYRYFVAVTRRDSVVLAKEYFTVDARFRPGQTVIRKRETIEGITIPRATETISGTNFEVVVGFELTPEQLAFNRSGKRFLMQTTKPSGG
jgi:hypothetical protein